MLSLSGRARLKPWKLRRKNLRSPSGWLKLNVHQPNKYPTDINRKYDNSHFKNSRTNIQCQPCNNINNSTQSYYATYRSLAYKHKPPFNIELILRVTSLWMPWQNWSCPAMPPNLEIFNKGIHTSTTTRNAHMCCSKSVPHVPLFSKQE